MPVRVRPSAPIEKARPSRRDGLFLCPGMAQFDKVNVLPQEVTAKYSNPQTGISGAKREEVVLQKRGTPFLVKSPRRRQSRLFSARGPAALRRTAQRVLFSSLVILMTDHSIPWETFLYFDKQCLDNIILTIRGFPLFCRDDVSPTEKDVTLSP